MGKRSIFKNKSEVVFITSLVGFGMSGYLTHKATVKAVRKIDEYEEKTKLTTKDKIKLTGRYYVTPALVFIFSSGCAIKVFNVQQNTIAGLIAAVNWAETWNSEYQSKVIEKLGEKKEEEIRKEINKDRLENTVITDDTFVNTGHGTQPCYDKLSNTFFLSDKHWLEHHVCTDISDMVRRDEDGQGYILLGDYYDMINLRDKTGDQPLIGQVYAWYSKDYSSLNDKIEWDFDGVPMMINGVETLVWAIAPKWNCMPHRAPDYC